MRTFNIKALGPGLILAATAIGVSHLVQSTRAGAEFGLIMIVFIVLGLATKYPTFLFAQKHATATGVSLLEGFRQQGKWALGLYLLVVLVTIFVANAAVSLVTAGLFNAALGTNFPAVNVATGLILFCSALVLIGHYQWLEIVIKVLLVVLTITTVIATILVLPLIDWSGVLTSAPTFDVPTLIFIAALIGWMPLPLDVTVWQSLWMLAKWHDHEVPENKLDARFDFNVGYALAGVLAICFLLLGNGVMYEKGVDFPPGATAFAIQLIDLYKQSLGAWSGPLISVTALTVMFSTVLSLTDGFPRSMATLISRFQGAETASSAGTAQYPRSYYVASLCLLIAGSFIILFFFMHSFRLMIQIATTAAFITAPIIAILVHRVITRAAIPEEARPGKVLLRYNIVCIVALSVFAIGYIVLILWGT